MKHSKNPKELEILLRREGQKVTMAKEGQTTPEYEEGI